jgi:hypothetical protein
VDRFRRLTGVACDETMLRETCLGLGQAAREG